MVGTASAARARREITTETVADGDEDVVVDDDASASVVVVTDAAVVVVAPWAVVVVVVLGKTMLSRDVEVPDAQSTGPPPTACHVDPVTWMPRVGYVVSYGGAFFVPR